MVIFLLHSYVNFPFVPCAQLIFFQFHNYTIIGKGEAVWSKPTHVLLNCALKSPMMTTSNLSCICCATNAIIFDDDVMALFSNIFLY